MSLDISAPPHHLPTPGLRLFRFFHPTPVMKSETWAHRCALMVASWRATTPEHGENSEREVGKCVNGNQKAVQFIEGGDGGGCPTVPCLPMVSSGSTVHTKKCCA